MFIAKIIYIQLLQELSRDVENNMNLCTCIKLGCSMCLEKFLKTLQVF